MRIEMEATERLMELEGVPVRLWEGRTDRGVRCLVFVHRLAVPPGEDSTEFDRELCAQLPPGLWEEAQSLRAENEALREDLLTLARRVHEQAELLARAAEQSGG